MPMGRIIGKDKLNLSTDNLNRMQTAANKMKDVSSFLNANTNASKRQNCQQAKFRLMISSFCVIAAGNASDNVTVNANGQITAIKVTPKSCEDFIRHCIDELAQACDLSSIQTTMVSAASDTSSNTTPTPATSPAYCTHIDALKTCSNQPNTCSDAAKTAVLQSGIAPFSDIMNINLDLGALATSTATLDTSLSANTTPTRRLQGASDSIVFAPVSTGAALDNISADANMSDASVENSVNIPDTLKSSARLLNLIAVLAMGYFF